VNVLSTRVLPVDRDEIEAMVHDLRGYRLITGIRGEPARDREALVGIIVSVARLFVSRPDLAEFDINRRFPNLISCPS
jgi:hypothetical protein